MFPVFSVLFRVCSQWKPLKRRAVPTVPSCFASDYFLKCDWATSKSSERSGNTGNIRNNALYQSVAMFPLEDPSGNTGNNRRERRHRSHRRIWERSKPNLRAPALAPVKPYPQASALSLVQPSATLRRFASLPRWEIPLSWTVATPEPRRSGRSCIAQLSMQSRKENSNYESQSNHSLWLYRPRRKNLSNSERS